MPRDGMVLTYNHLGDNDELQKRLEVLAEGAVQLNLVELQTGRFDDFPGLREAGIKYEKPRMTSEGQKVGTLSEVVRRGKATCIEAAAIEAALFQHDDGVDAFVKLVPEKYRDKIKPGRFHAVVLLPDGDVLDSSESLKGYEPAVGGAWGKMHGHCCNHCALGEECIGEASCNWEKHQRG